MRLKFDVRPIVAVAASACLISLSGIANATPVESGDGCPSVGTNWSDSGPFSVVVDKADPGHTIYRPAELAALDCSSNPVILWENGTFGVPTFYDSL